MPTATNHAQFEQQNTSLTGGQPFYGCWHLEKTKGAYSKN
jgi:hypothetical protein